MEKRTLLIVVAVFSIICISYAEDLNMTESAIQMIETRIQYVEKLINDSKERGENVEQARYLLSRSKDECYKGNYTEALNSLIQAEKSLGEKNKVARFINAVLYPLVRLSVIIFLLLFF